MRSIKIGVVGATGLVGEEFLRILSARKDQLPFQIQSMKLFASDKSRGQKIGFLGQDYVVETLGRNCFAGLDLVFFSSGDEISKEWAPQAVESGAYAVDNSAAFRMDAQVPLIVPEVNGYRIPSRPGIIANPNCSTIQLVVMLSALRKKFNISEVTVSSYQAISGAGKAAQEELIEQMKAYLAGQAVPAPVNLPKQILFNCIPQIGSFSKDPETQGYSSEEIKIIKETKKILEQPQLKVSAFTVRIPALNAHSESVWVTFDRSAQRSEVLEALNSGEGLVVDESLNDYPTALTTSGQDPVYVGRVRPDLENPNRWLFWVVSDNLRKGAALNGVQIAERIFDNSLK